MPPKKAPAEAAAPAKKPATRKPAARKPKGAVTEEMIRERAYYLSTVRDGSPEEHWLEAERELNGSKK
jgi:hypothetical protein